MKKIFQHFKCLIGLHDWSEWIFLRESEKKESQGVLIEKENEIVVAMTPQEISGWNPGQFSVGGVTLVKTPSIAFEISLCSICGEIMGRKIS